MKFLPLLILYLALAILFSKNELVADEVRYFSYAENLANGYYTEGDNPYLLNGPGYPFYLALFILADMPLLAPKIGNAFLLFFSVLFLYHTLKFYLPRKTATLLAYGYGLYYPAFQWIWFNYSECFALFLVTGFMFFAVKALRSERTHLGFSLLASSFLALLILTKVLFNYMLLASLGTALIYYLFTRNKKCAESMIILGAAYLLTAPFLIYSYSLTGRYFYWGTNGGEQLYWMTTHYESEYGSWVESTRILRRELPNVDPRHTAFYDSVYTKSWVEINEDFMEKGIANIKEDPRPYLYNVIANTLRLISDGPASFYHQSLRPFFYLFINSLLLVPLIFSLYPSWLNRKRIPFELVGLSIFFLFYFGCSMLLAAIVRYFLMVVPIIIVWIGFAYSRYIHFSFDYKPVGERGN